MIAIRIVLVVGIIIAAGVVAIRIINESFRAELEAPKGISSPLDSFLEEQIGRD